MCPAEPDPAYQARVAELRGEPADTDPARHEAEIDALVDAFSARIASSAPRHPGRAAAANVAYAKLAESATARRRR